MSLYLEGSFFLYCTKGNTEQWVEHMQENDNEFSEAYKCLENLCCKWKDEQVSSAADLEFVRKFHERIIRGEGPLTRLRIAEEKFCLRTKKLAIRFPDCKLFAYFVLIRPASAALRLG